MQDRSGRGVVPHRAPNGTHSSPNEAFPDSQPSLSPAPIHHTSFARTTGSLGVSVAAPVDDDSLVERADSLSIVFYPSEVPAIRPRSMNRGTLEKGQVDMPSSIAKARPATDRLEARRRHGNKTSEHCDQSSFEGYVNSDRAFISPESHWIVCLGGSKTSSHI